MARKTDRNFLADFNTLEIEYLPEKGPEVSSDIQMVYVMGNVAPAAATFIPGWTAPNPIPIEYSFNLLLLPVAAEFIRLELLALATGGGLYISAISDPTPGANGVNVWTLPAFTGLATRHLPTAANSSAWGTGAAATAIIDTGTSAVAPPATSEFLDISMNASARPEQFTGDGLTPVYIGPGRVFVMQHNVATAGEQFGISWREIA